MNKFLQAKLKKPESSNKVTDTLSNLIDLSNQSQSQGNLDLSQTRKVNFDEAAMSSADHTSLPNSIPANESSVLDKTSGSAKPAQASMNQAFRKMLSQMVIQAQKKVLTQTDEPTNHSVGAAIHGTSTTTTTACNNKPVFNPGREAIREDEEDDDDDPDYLYERDPALRKIKRLQWKERQIKKQKRPQLAKLSTQQRGWNAPDDQPYVPVGYITEIQSALEAVKREFPHTNPRLMKDTYRSVLQNKKNIREMQERVGQTLGQYQNKAQTKAYMEQMQKNLSQPPRMLQQILGPKKQILRDLRDQAFDEELETVTKQGFTNTGSMKIQLEANLPTGQYPKLQEKKERHVLQQAGKNGGDYRIKHFKQQDDKKAEHLKAMGMTCVKNWIRARNSKLYDEKIQKMTKCSTNGSDMLKIEIQESDKRLKLVKSGQPIQSVVPQHKNDYFLVDKERYFYGENRVLKEKEILRRAIEDAETMEIDRGEVNFSSAEKSKISNSVEPNEGVFLTQQLQNMEHEVSRIKANLSNEGSIEEEQKDQNVSQMFGNAHQHKQLYYETASLVKTLYMDRVCQSRGEIRQFDPLQRQPVTNVELKGRNLAMSLTNDRKFSDTSEYGTKNILMERAKSRQATTQNTIELKGFKGKLRSTSINLFRPQNTQQNTTISTNRTNRSNKNITTGEVQNSKREYSNQLLDSQRQTNSAYNGDMSSSHFQTFNLVPTSTAQSLGNSLFKPGLNTIAVGPEERKAKDETSFVKQKQQSSVSTFSNQYMHQQKLQQNSNLSIPTKTMTRQTKTAMSRTQANMKPQTTKAHSSLGHYSNQSHCYLNGGFGGHSTVTNAGFYRSQTGLDLPEAKNRVAYIQNLSRHLAERKQIDLVEKSDIYKGFSRSELHELLIENPRIKEQAKIEKRKAEQGEKKQPEFNNYRLIQLDTLDDIATKSKVEQRQKVFNEILSRKDKIIQKVMKIDESHPLCKQYNLKLKQQLSHKITHSNSVGNRVMQKFQNKTIDVSQDGDIGQCFDFQKSLKDRLNTAQAKSMERIRVDETANAEHKLFSTIRTLGIAKKLSQKASFAKQQSILIDAPPQSSPTLTVDHHQVQPIPQSQFFNSLRNKFYDLILCKAFESDQQVGREVRAVLGQGRVAWLQTQEQLSKILSIDQARSWIQFMKTTKMIEEAKAIEADLKDFDHGDLLVLSKLMERYPSDFKQKAERGTSAQEEQTFDTNLKQLLIKSVQVQSKEISRVSSQTITHQSDQQLGFNKTSTSFDLDNEDHSLQLERQQDSSTAAPNKSQNQHIGAFQKSKQDKQQFKKYYQKFLYNEIKDNYQQMFKVATLCKEADLEQIEDQMSIDELYADAKRFLVTQGKFLFEDQIIHTRQQKFALLSLYRLYIMYFVNQQLVALQKKFTIGKNKQLREDKDDEEYSDADFQDLMSNEHIEESIRIFYDRLQELINPIDHERLYLDQTHKIKDVVKQFYKRKASKCNELLQCLDQMRAERPTIMEVKRHILREQSDFGDQMSLVMGDQSQTNEIKIISQADDTSPYKSLLNNPYQQVPVYMSQTFLNDRNRRSSMQALNASTMSLKSSASSALKELRLSTDLFRLARYKHIASTLTWYNILLSKVIKEGIAEKPLTLYFLDSIKSVIETGSIFTLAHLDRIKQSCDQIDIDSREYKVMVSEIESLVSVHEVSQNCHTNYGDIEDQPTEIN